MMGEDNEELKFGPEEPFLDRVPEWPEFRFGDSEIDGLIPSCKIRSWRQLEEVLADGPHSSSVGQIIYRGHRRHEWQLAPGLSRIFNGGSISPHWAASLLRKFSLSMRGRGLDLLNQEDSEVWAVGQHFGLATPLMDWTESAYVALFFAFGEDDPKEEKDNPTRAIFCLNRSALDEIMPDFFFEPRFGNNSRLVNQAGLFTVTSPGGENPVSEIMAALEEAGTIDPDEPDPQELAKFICKIHIPNEDRFACLAMLRKMNIHHASLFPDPGGASNYCNDWLDRVVKEERQMRLDQVEARARDAAELARPVQMPEDETGAEAAVAEVLGHLARVEGAGVLELETAARRIHERYARARSIDWWAHPSGQARMKIDFKRLLSSMDWPESSRDLLADQFTQMYADRDRAVSGRM